MLQHCNTLRLLSRISNLLFDMDSARLLHRRCFAEEKVDELLEHLRTKSIYLRRSKSKYEKMFAYEHQQLHKEAGP
jgi:phosphoserine phosphatase